MNGEFLIESWSWFKNDFDLLYNSYFNPQSNYEIKSTSKDQKIYFASIRIFTLLSTAFLTLSGIKSFLLGSIVNAGIKIFGAVVFFDIFLLFKELTSIQNPLESAFRAGKGKGILRGTLSFGKSILNSTKSLIDLHENVELQGKINVNILTKNTNLSFLWRPILMVCFPSCFIDTNNESTYVER